MIEDILTKYFTTSTEQNNGIPLYLPLKFNGKTDKKGNPKPDGAMANLTKNQFIDLFNKKPVITNNGIRFTKETSYNKADLYELNFNVIDENIIVIDIDNIVGSTNPEELSKKSKEELDEWINTNVPEIIRKLPMTLSRNKQLPHYWCILDGITKDLLRDKIKITTKCLKFCDGDIVASHIWTKPNKKVLNYNGELPHIHIDDLKEFLNEKILKKIFEDATTDEDISEPEIEKEEVKENLNKTDEEKIIDNLRKVIECYSSDWFENYDNWRNFTMAFKNTFKEKQYGLYDEICRKFPKYDPDDNNKRWNSIKIKNKEDRKFSFGSIMFWGKEQNEKKYNEIFPSKVNNKIDWNRLTDATYAEMMYNLYFRDEKGNQMLIFTGDKKIPDAYFYNGVYWESVGQNLCIIKNKKFTQLYKYYNKQLDRLMEEYKIEKEQYDKLKIKIQDLDKNRVRDDIIKIMCSEYYDNKISQKWNQNKDLYVFENKIYDLSKGIFIDPSPDQYINMSCGYEYNNGDYREEIEEINTFIDSILDHNDLVNQKKYLMTVLSSFLRQSNKEEKAYFFLGRGRNGKGTLSVLLNNVLGNYWGELNIEYYTVYDKSPNAHKQNLYDCRNSRLLNTSEVADTDMNGNSVKFIYDKFCRITGNDTMVARQCGDKETVEFKAGKILIQTNTLPVFSKQTNALKERIVIINFPYTFTDDEQKIKTNPNIYKKIDRSLKDKFDTSRYKNAFISMLFDFYKEYLKENSLIIPLSIKKNSEEYFSNTSNVENWFFENFENVNSFISKNKDMFNKDEFNDKMIKYDFFIGKDKDKDIYIHYEMNDNDINKHIDQQIKIKDSKIQKKLQFDIKYLKDKYYNDNGIDGKRMSDIQFREQLKNIEGFDKFIVKTSGYFYLRYFIEIEKIE